MRYQAVFNVVLEQVALVLVAIAILIVPDRAPALVAATFVLAAGPWHEAWCFTRGTALRPVLIWVALALVLSLVAQFVALAEPVSDGRPWTGRLTYFSVLAVLAALTSVLNARAPGGRVWAGLMIVLVVVFLIPWLEGPWRLHQARGLGQLHLDAPWTIFYALLVLVGVTNYLPTRFAVAAGWLAVGFVLEYLGLTRDDLSAEHRAMLWSGVSLAIATGAHAARRGAWREPAARTRLERLWFWFRDLWGVVWALRIQERFNRTAVLKNWPVRLSWYGLVRATNQTAPVEPDTDTDANTTAIADLPEAEAAFRALIRRFAVSGRLDEVLAAAPVATSCDRDNAAG